MILFTLRRFATIPVVMLVLSLTIFIFMQALPANRNVTLPGVNETGGFYTQYGRWLRAVFRGDLGTSKVFNQPVLEIIWQRLPATMEMALIAFVPIMVLGIALGALAARYRGSFLDRVISVVAITAWSTPTFVFAIWLLVIFYGRFGLFGTGRIADDFALEMVRGTIRPVTNFMLLDSLLNRRMDMFLDGVGRLVLPVTTLVFIMVGRVIQLMRSSMLEVLGKDYIRTARAKGLAEAKLTRKHALKNALIPVLTIAGVTFSGLITGVIVVESVFDIDGVGAWFTVAAATSDTLAVVGFALTIALISLLTNLLVDITYGIADPRIRYD
jgi:peptide/nickel transport system permease protein